MQNLHVSGNSQQSWESQLRSLFDSKLHLHLHGDDLAIGKSAKLTFVKLDQHFHTFFAVCFNIWDQTRQSFFVVTPTYAPIFPLSC